MTSRKDTRELVWIHIKDNPRIAVNAISEALGLERQETNCLLRQLLDARLLSREPIIVPASNATGGARAYLYWTTSARYTYESKQRTKQTKQAKAAPAPAPKPAPPPVSVPRLATTAFNEVTFRRYVDSLTVGQLKVMKRVIDEAFV